MPSFKILGLSILEKIFKGFYHIWAWRPSRSCDLDYLYTHWFPLPIDASYRKLIGINDFSFQFRKIITRYRRIGYNLNVMRQSACLVFNPIMVDNYAAFFNCTPVGRASDSMMARTSSYSF